MNLDSWKRLAPKRDGWQVGAALVFILAGFVAIGIAWNGAASVDFAQGQLPYLLSGGAAGLALVGVGLTLILFEGARRSRVHLDQRLDLIAQLLEESRGASAHPQNGHKAVPQGAVVVGRSSYHMPDCRLVNAKEDHVFATREDAEARGLQPCRVCMPALVPD